MANDANDAHAGFKYYHYNPSMAAAIIFIILFLISTFFHMFQLLRTRAWIMIPFLIGGFFETIGYIGRAASAHETPNWTLGPYIIQSILLLVAPALFAASIYMLLGRIIDLVDGEKYSLIRLRWLTKVFVIGDVLSFFMQGGGGGIMAQKDAEKVKLGQHIILGGLFVQIIFFGLFIIVAVLFQTRLNGRPTQKSLGAGIPWKKHMMMLYLTSILIMIRSIFRVVEYIQGFDGYLLGHETYLYVFDACLMLAVMLLYNWVHPSEITALLKGGPWTRGVTGKVQYVEVPMTSRV